VDSMSKPLLLFISLFSFISSIAQDALEYKEPSKESRAYHEKREVMTKPPFGLQKVAGLISNAKTDEEDNKAINKNAYHSLSFREKFTYHMIHGESYSQNCDGYPPIQDEQKKIFAQLPELYGEYDWSDRQIKFFKDNKDSVINLMKLSIEKNKKVGLNFKHAIVEINATEMIPVLIKVYNVERKDHDILTVLLLLMRNEGYGPFKSSASYKKLYNYEKGYDENYYSAHLTLNKANQDLIVKRALDFYNGLSR
jgi:hypothetical protein